MNKKVLLWTKIMDFSSKHLGCHQMATRSFFIKGYQFPVCARCTGIAIGYIIGFILSFIFKFNFWILILVIPMILDGTIQLYTKYESSNIKRLITGFLFGFSIMSAIVYLVRIILYKIIILI